MCGDLDIATVRVAHDPPSQNNSLFIKSEKSNLILFALTRQQLFSAILHQRWFSKKKFKCKSTLMRGPGLQAIPQESTAIGWAGLNNL
jgi:hypothetical protein